MKLSGNTILITGGSEGIGFALAKALVTDNTVIICGRSARKLALAKEGLPEVITEVCDVTDPEQRAALVERVVRAHPRLNVLINNAGGRQVTDLLTGEGVDRALEYDMALNFIAPADLSGKLIGHLRAQPRAAVINVTTGLVYLPKAAQTFYCAAKSALHSYTQSLRWVLNGSPVRVFEVLVTLADTNFHQGNLPMNIKALSADDIAKETLRGIRRNQDEIRIGKSALARWIAFLAPKRGMAIVNMRGA